MSEEIVDPGTAPEIEAPGPEATTETATSENPAWNDFLKGIPESMHNMVKPHLSEWDKNVQSRIDQVHGQYSDFKPYIDAGINSGTLNEALQIYEALNTNPAEVYRILSETYGQIQQQNPQPNGQPNGAPQGELEGVAEYENGQGGQFDPEVARLKEMTNTMAQLLIQQENARQEFVADQELDRELGDLRKKFGDYDENFVLGYMNVGMSGEDAVKAFLNIKNEILTQNNRPPAPITLSGSNTLPSNAINPASLNNKDTKNLVANIFRAANQQGV